MNKSRPSTPRPSCTRGFTLVESLFALTLFVVLILVVAHASVRASDAYEEGSDREELETTTHRLLDRITEELETAGGGVLLQALPQLAASTVTFQEPIGFAGGDIQWGPAMTVGLELEPGELDDGVDNDGDGFADEGRVVWTESPGQATERRVVLGNAVSEYLQGELANGADDNGNGLLDERGLSFAAQDDVLIIRITCQRLDDGRRPMTKTVQTSIQLQN